MLVLFGNHAKKDLQKYNRSGSFPLKKLEKAIDSLRKGILLPVSFQDHRLKGALSDFREFHLAADILVRYEVDTTEEVVTISRIGTHTELFSA